MNLKSAIQAIAGEKMQSLFVRLYGKENIACQQVWRLCRYDTSIRAS